LAISQVIFYLKDIDTKIHKQRAWSKRRTGARMLAGPASEPVRARVLRVLRDGAATSLVAQMLHSNAVLKCAVGGWRQAGQAEGAAAATNGSKPNEQNKPNLLNPLNANTLNANTLKPGHLVLLRVLACAPPEIRVEVARAENAADLAAELAADLAAELAATELEPAAEPAADAAPAQRKRQFLGRLP
jgi:hypothetical protein